MADLLAQPLEPVHEVVKGLIERGITTLLTAPGDHYKSTLALQLGLCIAAGASVWGRAVEQCTFLYLSYEDDNAEVHRRVARMLPQLGLPEDISRRVHVWDFRSKPGGPLYNVTAEGETDGPMLARLRARLRAIPGHVFIAADSAYNVSVRSAPPV